MTKRQEALKQWNSLTIDYKQGILDATTKIIGVPYRDINSLTGHKVKCWTFSAGTDLDEKIARKYLEIGKEYTVESTTVDDWHTDVKLQEFPDVNFNSVFFEDVSKQSKEQNMKHPDYLMYN